MEASFLKTAVRRSQYPFPDKPEVAFAGRSNVGKSSLINTLANRKGLARTSSTPGRTQAINFFEVGGRLVFVDLPGYGFAKVPLAVKAAWKTMVEAYLTGRPNLKAVVLIMDVRRDPSPGDLELLRWLGLNALPCIPVLTKADKLSRQKASARMHRLKRLLSNAIPTEPILFSARTRQGKEAVWEHINHAVSSP
jgi:GTP-binding protein